jgi:protein-S-isoprenylcysteine O-methyltransferase Ste14
MKLSIHATIVAAAIFAAVCLAFALTGFTSLSHLTDPTEIADAKGFAWFWTFLASVAIALGLVAWWILRRTRDSE